MSGRDGAEFPGNSDFVTLTAAALFAKAVGLALGAFLQAVPLEERSAARLVRLLRVSLDGMTEVHPQLSARDLADLEQMRGMLVAVLSSPEVGLFAPSEGPPH